MNLSKVLQDRNVRSTVKDGVCTCAEPENVIQDIASMESLFIAEVVSQRTDPSHADIDRWITTVKVKELLFGYFTEGEELEIHHDRAGNVCGFDFDIGTETLISVYVEVDENCDYRLATDSCSMPYYTAEEYRAALRGENCPPPHQTQEADGLNPVGLKLVVLEDDDQISGDQDSERLVMRIASATRRVKEYWIG